MVSNSIWSFEMWQQANFMVEDHWPEFILPVEYFNKNGEELHYTVGKLQYILRKLTGKLIKEKRILETSHSWFNYAVIQLSSWKFWTQSSRYLIKLLVVLLLLGCFMQSFYKHSTNINNKANYCNTVYIHIYSATLVAEYTPAHV